MKAPTKVVCAAIATIAGIFSPAQAGTGPGSRFAWDGSRYIVGTDHGLLTSSDAKTWRPLGKWSESENVAAIASNGKITIAFGWDDRLRRISGDTITLVESDHFWRNPLYEYAFWTGSEFIMAGGNDTLLHSRNGIDWTSSQCRFNARGGSKVALGDSGMIFVPGGGTDAAFSKDGYVWSYTPLRAQLRDVIWSGDRYILVGDQGLIAWSKNGKDWLEDSVLKETFRCKPGISCPTLSDGTSTTENTDDYHNVYGIARLGTTVYILDGRGIRVLGDFGIGPYLQEFKSDFWPLPWGEAGSRIFSLADDVIWSTSNGADSLVGVIDTSAAPRTSGIHPIETTNPEFRLDASGLHGEFAEPRALSIDLLAPNGSVRNIARGRYEPGVHTWKTPGGAGFSHLRILTDKGVEVLSTGLRP